MLCELLTIIGWLDRSFNWPWPVGVISSDYCHSIIVVCGTSQRKCSIHPGNKCFNYPLYGSQWPSICMWAHAIIKLLHEDWSLCEVPCSVWRVGYHLLIVGSRCLLQLDAKIGTDCQQIQLQSLIPMKGVAPKALAHMTASHRQSRVLQFGNWWAE